MNHPVRYGLADVNLYGVISSYRWQQFVWIVLVAVVVRVLSPDFGIHSVVSVRFVFGWPLDFGVALYRKISHGEIDDRSVEGHEHDLLAILNRPITDRNQMIREHVEIADDCAAAADADRTASF